MLGARQGLGRGEDRRNAGGVVVGSQVRLADLVLVGERVAVPATPEMIEMGAEHDEALLRLDAVRRREVARDVVSRTPLPLDRDIERDLDIRHLEPGDVRIAGIELALDLGQRPAGRLENRRRDVGADARSDDA